MKKHLVLLALAAFAHAGAWATTTYVFTGANYLPAQITNYTAAPCNQGDCANFTTAMKQTGSFTISAPLAPNLAGVNVKAQITSFSFHDGLTQYTNGNSELFFAVVWTNAQGDITGENIAIARWQATPGKYDFIGVNLMSAHNQECPAPLPSSTGACLGPPPASIPYFSKSYTNTGLAMHWETIQSAQAVQAVPVDNPFALVLTATGLLGLALQGRRKLLLKNSFQR